MKINKLLIVHLSDIHINSKEDGILNRARQLAAAVYQQLPLVAKVLIAVSGDIAWSGLDCQYDLAENFLKQFVDEIKGECPSVEVDIVVCPGNHDIDFSVHDEIREAILNSIRIGGVEKITPKVIDVATTVQSSFFRFRDRVTTLNFDFDNRLVWEHRFELGGGAIGVRCLNVAWMSELKEKQGMLLFPDSFVRSIEFHGKHGLSVTLLHHPFNWYAQSSYHAFRNAVRHESHLVLTGHEHFQSVGETQDVHSSASVFLEGGVLFENESRGSTSNFNIVVVDLEDDRYVVGLYSWDGERYKPNADESEWGSFRPLPTKGCQRYPLTDSFEVELTDPGARFSHPAKKELNINDIFVWPELKCLDDVSTIKPQLTASWFESQENVGSRGVFIKGDEKTGKTTLLHQYFQSYYTRGYIPLYIKGTWLQKQHIKDPLKVIAFALDRQYVKTVHLAYRQESRDKKILLLDDLHRASLSSSSLSNCLDELFKSFGAVIVMAKDGPESFDVLSVDRVPALRELAQYELREFGHKKRYELVRRWAAIGGGGGESSQSSMATIDKMEKDLTTAVGRQLIPSVPIFLLTLLQSVEAKRSADLQNSALGHYYQYLITSSLEAIGVQREQWSEVFNYCSNLAWTFFSSSMESISDRELVEFGAHYSKEFTPIAPARRLRELCDAGILIGSEDVYQFRYPYLYYMFLGQYLAEHIHETEVDQTIARLCEDLHLHDNANILLFIGHHTRSPIIYERIKETLKSCFFDEKPFDFVKDVDSINRLINSAPKLLFEDSPGRDTRAEIREHQDQLESASEDRDVENTTESVAAVTRLFRGMEILGQFLKNHYGTTRNPIKNELIDSLMQSALRGLQGFIAVFIEEHELLTKMVERLITSCRSDLLDHEREILARQIIFNVTGLVAFAFVQKASSCVGSAFLKENVAEVVAQSESLTYRLIEMSHQLDLPEPIPFERLRDLQNELEKNLFATTLLRSLALRHLHMFKVTFRDKQRLCSQLGIELSHQMAIQNDRRKA